MNQNIWSLIGFAAVALIVVGGLAFLSQHYTLDNIKSKTVGDGQYGTARWATKREIKKHIAMYPSSQNSGGRENICRDSRAWCWAVLAGKIMLQHWWIATISTA